MHVLTCVIGRVDCFGCVCPPDSNIKYTVFYSKCVLTFMYYTVCYFTGIFYAVVRQISMLCIILCVILLVSFMQS